VDSIREIYSHLVICHRLILIQNQVSIIDLQSYKSSSEAPPGFAAFPLIRLYVRLISESRITSFGPLLCCSFSILRVYGQDFLLKLIRKKLRLKTDLYSTAWLVRNLGAGPHQRKTLEMIEKVLESTWKLERL